MTADDLTRLRDVAEAATPGPWRADENDSYVWVKDDDGEVVVQDIPLWADAEFIAAFDPPTVAALIDRVERAERERDEVRVYNCGDCGHRIDNHGDEGRCSIRFARVGVWAQCPCISPTAVRIAQLESGWRKTNAECIAHWNRADKAEAELAALRAAVKGLADATGSAFPYVQVRELRTLLTEGADDGQ